MLTYVAMSVAIAVAVDWLVVGKIAATLLKRDYTYKPTFRRSVVLACIVAWVVYVDLYRPGEGYRSVLLIALVTLGALYFLLASFDVRKQPEREVLPRYGEQD